MTVKVIDLKNQQCKYISKYWHYYNWAWA